MVRGLASDRRALIHSAVSVNTCPGALLANHQAAPAPSSAITTANSKITPCAPKGAATFGNCNQQNQRLFRLNPGICAEEALEHASLLMGCANTLTHLRGLEQGTSTLDWAAHYLGDMAQAIIDDVMLGMQATARSET